jgi:hypothetical protein
VHRLLHVDIHSLPPVPEMIQNVSMGSQGHHSCDCRVSVKTNTNEKVAGCVHDVPDVEICKGAKDSERQMEPLLNVEEDGSNETLVHRRLVWIKVCSTSLWSNNIVCVVTCCWMQSGLPRFRIFCYVPILCGI